jgi:hypothetical protein
MEIVMQNFSCRVALALRSSVAALAMGLGLLGFTGTSRADLFVQNSDHCTSPGPCGIDPLNTVTVTGTNTLTVTVQLAPNWSFVQTGSHQSFDFSLGNGFSSVQGTILAGTSDAANWAFLNASGTTVTGQSSIQDDGLTIPQWAYALNHTTTGNNVDGSTLVFTISAAGLTTSSFNQLLLNDGTASGSFFAADVLSANGATGVIDFGLVPAPLAGAGLPGLVMACTGLVALARRRRKLAV